MAQQAKNKDGKKVKFIRKNGKVIPIRSNGKGGDNKTKKKDFKGARQTARKLIDEESRGHKASRALNKRQDAFRSVGAVTGLISGAAIGSKGKLGVFGALVGLYGGVGVGSAIGSSTKKSKLLASRAKKSSKRQTKLIGRGYKQAGMAFDNVIADEYSTYVSKKSNTGF